MGILLLWSGLCTILSEDHLTAFWGEFYLNDGFASYCIYAAVFICGASVVCEKSRKFILQLYSLVVCYLALIMLAQQFDFDFLNYCFPSTRAVVFNQFNHFGYVLCMAIMALLGLFLYDRQAKRGKRILYLLGFAFLSYSLMLNDTFGAYLATVLAFPFIYVFYYRSGRRAEDKHGKLYIFAPLLIFILLSVMNIFGLLPFTDALFTNWSRFGLDILNTIKNNDEAAHAGTGRLTLWRDTIERIKERPIFGFGPMGFSGEHAITNGDSPHNEYLQIAGFLGIPGLILYLSALITLFLHHWKNIKKLDPMVLAVSGCTVVYLISACFGNPVFNTVPFFWIFIGMTTVTSEQDGSIFALDQGDLERVHLSAISVKKIAPVILTAVFLLGGGLIATSFLTAESEQDRELSDLQNMQCAQLAGKLVLKNYSLKEKKTYWYDDDSLALLEQTEPMPDAYGKGKSKAGGGNEAFTAEPGVEVEYDESVAYTGKIIQVTLNPVDNTVSLEWISTEDISD